MSIAVGLDDVGVKFYGVPKISNKKPLGEWLLDICYMEGRP
tara:strand:- start:81614 stop:81736 length:123 start_codon:yes stop_codon:yes gene_type:complete